MFCVVFCVVFCCVWRVWCSVLAVFCVVWCVLAFWGVWGVISSILNIAWLTAAPIYWVTFLASAVLASTPASCSMMGTSISFGGKENSMAIKR